jgi:WD40 repeat protein
MVGTLGPLAINTRPHTLTGHSREINAVALGSLDGRPIAITGSGDETVRIWDLTDGSLIGQPLTGGVDPV